MAAIASNRDIMEIIKNASEQIPIYIQTVTIVAQSIESLNTINIKSLQKGVSNAQRLTIVIDSYITALDEMLLKLDFVNTVDTSLTSKLNSLTEKGGLIGDEKSGIIGMVASFGALSDNILSIGKKALKMKLFGKIIASGVKTIISVAASIVEQIEKSGLAKKEIDTTWTININKILDALKSICTALLSLALLMPLAIIAGAIVIHGMVVFSLIIAGITAVIALIGMIDISNVIESVNNLLSVLKSIEKIVLHLILLAILIPLGILAGTIVLVGLIFLSIVLITISLILWGLGALLDSIKLPKLIAEIIEALLLLNTVILLLLLTATLMILLQLAADAVKFSIIWTFLGQLAILLIVLLVVGLVLSAVGTYLAPAAAAMIIAVGAIALVVGLILLIAVFLWSLQNIYIDKKAIEKNVQKIMGTIYMILETIFNSTFEAGGGQKSDSWFEQVLSFMGGSVKQLLSAIMAVFILAITFVAIGLILFIATELRILQEIDIEKDKITENVNHVISTAFSVVSAIFGSYERPEKNTPESWFESVLKWAGGTFLTIIEAILAVSFLALTLISITLILFIASELKLIQNMYLERRTIEKNIQTVIDTAQMVINAIFDSSDDKEDKPSDKGFFLTLLEFLCKPLANIFTAIMAIGFLALIFVSIGLITLIAAELKVIENIQINSEGIKKKIIDIINSAKYVIHAIIQPDDSQPKEAKGIFRKILEIVLPSNMLNMIDALMAIGFLALAKSAIGLIGEIAANLTTIAKLPSMSGINGKVDQVISSAKLIINKIINNDDEISSDNAEKLLNITNNIKQMANSMDAIGKLTIATNSITIVNSDHIASVQKSVNSIVSILDNITYKSDNNVERKLHQLNYLNNIIKNFNNVTNDDVKNTESLLRNYTQFLDKVNTVKLENIKTTTNLFTKMAELSSSINGDFQGLADVLNEKIAPLLEELKKVMSDVQVKIEQTGSNISSSVYASTRNSLTSSEMAEQTSREIPYASQEQQNLITQKRLEQQAQYQSMDLSSKLDELIDMFRNGEAYVRGRS